MITEVGKRLINVEEYLKMSQTGILGPNDHVELIHGEILNMSPVRSEHAAVVKKLAKILNISFENRFCIWNSGPCNTW